MQYGKTQQHVPESVELLPVIDAFDKPWDSFFCKLAIVSSEEVDVYKKENVTKLITLSSLNILLLVAVAGSSIPTVMNKHYTMGTFHATSALKAPSVEPMGFPGSGRGQGPVPLSSFTLFKANTSIVC